MSDPEPIQLALKVDVDTRIGTTDGVPRLAGILSRYNIKASFYFSLGPDNSGKAVWRVFTRPGFLAKQLRTGGSGAYGIRTLLYGTLLPAPIIGKGLGSMLPDLEAEGHEVGLHAWDHVRWHDRLWRMSPREIEAEVGRGVEAFIKQTGSSPRGFAAPAWRINRPAAEALKSAGVEYMAATRGRFPYLPVFEDGASGLLEIPTTMPTADEVLGSGEVARENLDDYFLAGLGNSGLQVMTVHAEMEGRWLAEVFEKFLVGCLERGVTFLRLRDIAAKAMSAGSEIPSLSCIRKSIPGRPGDVSHQL